MTWTQIQEQFALILQEDKSADLEKAELCSHERSYLGVLLMEHFLAVDETKFHQLRLQIEAVPYPADIKGIAASTFMSLNGLRHAPPSQEFVARMEQSSEGLCMFAEEYSRALLEVLWPEVLALFDQQKKRGMN